jgi:hypothetical protein
MKRKPGHAGILESFAADDAGASRALLRHKGSGRQSSLVTAADRETAGVVLFAKQPATCARYHPLFGEREVAKTYQAIAPGNALLHLRCSRQQSGDQRRHAGEIRPTRTLTSLPKFGTSIFHGVAVVHKSRSAVRTSTAGPGAA